MYCRSCGKELEDNLIKCSYCGEQIITERLLRDRDSSILWGLLAFNLPFIGTILGIILFFVWKNYKPHSAKASLIGGLLSIILIIIGIILAILEC